jgi:hypothetical protein
MPSANYIQRPEVSKCIQWDGTNAADVEAQVNNGRGYTFAVDSNGNATLSDPYYHVYPVPTGDWLVTDVAYDGTVGDTHHPMDNTSFQQTFIAGSIWAVGA